MNKKKWGLIYKLVHLKLELKSTSRFEISRINFPGNNFTCNRCYLVHFSGLFGKFWVRFKKFYKDMYYFSRTNTEVSEKSKNYFLCSWCASFTPTI